MFKEWYHRVYKKSGMCNSWRIPWLPSTLAPFICETLVISCHRISIGAFGKYSVSRSVCETKAWMHFSHLAIFLHTLALPFFAFSAFFYSKVFCVISRNRTSILVVGCLPECGAIWRCGCAKCNISWCFVIFSLSSSLCLSRSRSFPREFEINGWGTFAHNNIWCRCCTPTDKKCTRFLTELDTFHYCHSTAFGVNFHEIHVNFVGSLILPCCRLQNYDLLAPSFFE